MKNLSWIVNGVLAVAVVVLFYLHFKDCKSCTKGATTTAGSGKSSQVIAYVDIDSLETNYQFFKDKKAELEKRGKSIESSLQADAESLQRAAYDLQQRAATITQAEGEAIQERLINRKAELERKQAQLSESLIADQTKFNVELNAKLDSFLTEYNADKRYAYILSYSKGGSILYKDSMYNVTKDVIKGMNERYKSK